jgi:hypothetical protein
MEIGDQRILGRVLGDFYNLGCLLNGYLDWGGI